MKKVCTKCIVAALLLSFGISAGLPAAAAEVQPAQIVVAAEAVQNTTQEKAKQYFANYPSDKHVISVERFLEVLGSEEKNCVIDLRSEECSGLCLLLQRTDCFSDSRFAEPGRKKCV